DASLFRRQDRPHFEHMGDGRLLQGAHGVVEMVDRSAHLGAVALAGGDGLSQFAVGGPDVTLQGFAPNVEPSLYGVQSCFLLGAQGQFAVHDLMQAGRLVPLHHPTGAQPGAAGAGQSRQNHGQGDRLPVRAHPPTSTRVRGNRPAETLKTWMSDGRGLEAWPRTPPLVTPTTSATARTARS